MPLPPLREDDDRILGDTAELWVSVDARSPGDEAFASLDALAEKFNLAAGRRGSPAPRPADLLTFGVTAPSSILKLSPEATAKSSKMRPALQRLVTDASVPSEDLDSTLVKLCRETHKRPELRDELLLACLALTRGNDNAECGTRAWDMMHCLCASVTPTDTFAPFLGDYLSRCASGSNSSPTAHRQLVQKAFAAHKRCVKGGARRHAPSQDDFRALRADLKLSTQIFFLDDTFEELPHDLLTTVGDATPSLALAIKLKEYKTFGLFEVKRKLQVGMGIQSEDDDESQNNGESSIALKDDQYLSDVLMDHKRLTTGGVSSSESSQNDTSTPDATSVKLVFQKRMFREGDELITEPVFVSLSYLQVKHDFLTGKYPVNFDDAIKLAAFQIQAEDGGKLGQKESLNVLASQLKRFIPESILRQKGVDVWAMEVRNRHSLLVHDTTEDSKLGVLKMVRALPYGGALFFSVKKIEDPIGLLPGKIVLGVNKRGVHFFRPTPMEYLHSAELRDIMQFGSSHNAVFFKMRVAGVLHVFQFETNDGEQVCVNLQTHINDVMTKRYNEKKAKKEEKRNGAVSDGGSCGSGGSDPSTPPLRGWSSGGAPTAPTGESPELRRVLVAANRKIEELSSERASLREERGVLREKLKQLKESFEGETETQSEVNANQSIRIEELEHELSTTSSRLQDAELRVQQSESNAGDSDEHVSVLTNRLAEVTQARDAESERARLADTETRKLERELHKFKNTSNEMASDLRQSLEEEKQQLTEQLQETEEKLRDVEGKFADARRELENVSQQLNATQEQLKEVKEEANSNQKQLEELDSLREMRDDIERKEQQTAAIIRRQKDSLELLERKYKEESHLRKSLFNTIEDMKGKIRVYARTRPLSKKELKEGQTQALNLPDSFTMEHGWKDEKKPRQYGFDKVFGSDVSQEKVFADTKYLVQSAFDGYNVCIFAYGQTGSGKTHTVYGDNDNPGLTPRAVEEVMSVIHEGQAKGKTSVTTNCYMLELYQDSMNDLLLPSEVQQKGIPPRLDIKKDQKGWVTVQNATVVSVSSKDDILSVIDKGLGQRKTTSTKMNVESSRSHLIFSLVMETTDLQTQNVTKGKLSFVDLAGSERVKKSGATGDTMKEAQAINKSLSALGDVISALADEKQHIPYRNHKLTMLMSDSLGGNAKTLMFVNVSPSDGNLEETQNSLTYATRVRTIKNSASKDVADKEMQRLRSALASWRTRAGELEQETQDIENRVQTELVGNGMVPKGKQLNAGASRVIGGPGRLPNL